MPTFPKLSVNKKSGFTLISKASKGFTLIELLIVVSIIGVIALIGIASYQAVTKSGRDSKRQTDLKAIQSEMERYFADQGFYPAQVGETGMQTALDSGAAFTSSTGNPAPPASMKTYFNKLPQDSSNGYKYIATPVNCSNLSSSKCSSYCLYADLEKDSSVSSVCESSTPSQEYNFDVSPP